MISLQVVLFLPAMLGVCGAIRCYQCNTNISSAADISSSCNDPINLLSNAVTICDQPSSSCVKLSATNFGQTITERGCLPASSDGCSIQFTSGYIGTGCSCSSNLCNTAHKLQATPTIAAVITATITALAAIELFK